MLNNHQVQDRESMNGSTARRRNDMNEPSRAQVSVRHDSSLLHLHRNGMVGMLMIMIMVWEVLFLY